MRDGLIELGEITRAPEVPVTGARPEVSYRVLLGVLSLVLVLLLGGGPYRRPQEPPMVIPARLGDATFIDGDRLFVVSAGRPVLRSDMLDRVVSAYTLPEGRLASRTTTVARVIAAGGTSTTPSDFVYGRIAEVSDPFGARFSVGSRPSHSQG